MEKFKLIDTFEKKKIKLMFEVRKVHYLNCPAYRENFELRDRLYDFTASYQIMIYPRLMVVNKT